MRFVAEIFWRYKLLWMPGVGLLSTAHKEPMKNFIHCQNICCWQLGPPSAVNWHKEKLPPLESGPSQGRKGRIFSSGCICSCSQPGQRFWHGENLIFIATSTSLQRPGVWNWWWYASVLKYQVTKTDEQDASRFLSRKFLFFHLFRMKHSFLFLCCLLF